MKETKPDDIRVQNGIVGFFDILGYKSFLSNNNPAEEGVKEVLKSLANIGDDLLLPFDSEAKDQQAHEHINDCLKTIIFSDTIMMTIELPERTTSRQLIYRYMGFLMFCLRLNRKMFDFGLPLRGAIDMGEFVSVQNCFAGKVIVRSYEETQKLDLAATIISHGAYDYYSALMAESRLSYKTPVSDEGFQELKDIFFVEHLIPLNDGQKKKQRALNILTLDAPGIPEINPDIRGYVVESFSKHKKDIPPEVYPKLNNTEMLLRAGFALVQKRGKQVRIGSRPESTGLRVAAEQPPSPPE